MIFSIRFILLISFVTILSGCQTMDNMVKKFQDIVGISIAVKMNNPPNYPAAAKIKKIAVIGDDTDIQMRNDAEAMLANIQLNNRPYFTLVERQDIQRIRNIHVKELTEHTFDKDAVAEYGRWLGTDGIYMITNVKYNDTERSFTKERSECVNMVKKKCSKFKLISEKRLLYAAFCKEQSSENKVSYSFNSSGFPVLI